MDAPNEQIMFNEFAGVTKALEMIKDSWGMIYFFDDNYFSTHQKACAN